MKQAVLSLSGGMDSSTVLLHLLRNNYEVTAVSFNYGQKHNIELERAQQLVDYLKENGHNVNYQEITLFGLVDLLNSNLADKLCSVFSHLQQYYLFLSICRIYLKLLIKNHH